MSHRKLWFALTLLGGLTLVACGDEAGPAGDRVTAVIQSITPAAGFVPADIELVGDVEAVEGVDVEDLQVSWDFGDGSGSSGSFRVTHSYEQAGTFTVSLTVREVASGGETRAQHTARETVSIYPKADLRVSIPFVSERALRSQDDLRVTFDLFNDAGEVPVPFEMGVYMAQPDLLDPSSPPDTDTLQNLLLGQRVFVIDTVTLDSFGGEGSTTNIDRQGIRVPGEVPSGRYEILVYADHTGVVGEFDEQDNVGFASQPVEFINTTTEGPDLFVSEVRARPSRTNLLEQVTLDIEISNPGTESASFFDYEIYLSFINDLLEDGDLLIGSGSLDLVPSGSTADIEDLVIDLDESQVAIGNYFVLVVADSGDDVEEANESNNIGSSAAIIVTDEPIPGTDLIPTQLTFDPLTSFLDGSVTLRASVLNQGVEATPRQFFCRVFLSEDDDLDPLDDDQLDTLNFPVLAGGEEHEETRISRIPGFFDPGLFYVFLYCDPNFQIPEADEDNNVLRAEGRLEVSTDPEIDLRFGTFDIQPRTVLNEEDVTIDMSVCNDGTNGAGPSVARVIISADSTIDVNDTVLFESQLDPVDADDCIEVLQDVPATCDTFQPNYTVFAELDVTDVLPETDENNNALTLDTPLTIDGVICECEIDVLERNSEGNNNSPATPTFVSARVYDDLTMCDLAVDWYAIPLVRSETVRVVVTFENDRGNLDMTLYSSDWATILDESTSDGDREEVIAFVVPETGDFLLKVAGRTTFDVNAYTMTIDVSPPQTGTDLIASGVTLSDDRPVLAEAVEVAFDIYNLGDVAAGASTTRLYVSEDIEIDPLDDELVGEIVVSDVPAAGRQHRVVTVSMPNEGPGGGRYLAVVADALNEVTGELDETNNVSFSDLFELDAGCFDPLEPNNSLDEPYTVTLNDSVSTLSGLLVCSDNRDFYEICGEANDFLTMTVSFDGEVSDIDLHLYDGGGTLLTRSEGTSDQEILEVDYLPVEQCYVLEVFVVGRDQEAPYQLVIETGDAPPELICSPSGEPNEGFSTAAPLGGVLDSDLAICPVQDIDYFTINTSAGTRLEFRFVPVEGEDTIPEDLRMSFWGVTRNFLANTVAADEPLIYTTTAQGQHYLRVTSLASGPRNQRYRIDVDGLDGRDLEPIDVAISPAVAAPGERVQYTFTIANNRTLESGDFSYGIFLSDDPVIESDTDELLESVQVSSIAGTSSRTFGDKVTLPIDAIEGALTFLGVFVDYADTVDEIEESNNIAVLPLQILESCTVDGAEPNNLSVDWADLATYEGADLWLCSDDVDWFRLDVNGLSVYTIDATFLSENGDLDLYIYDSDLTLIASGESLGDNEQVSFTAPADAEHVFVEVAPFGLTNLLYKLAVTP